MITGVYGWRNTGRARSLETAQMKNLSHRRRIGKDQLTLHPSAPPPTPSALDLLANTDRDMLGTP